jgi:D-3-phosphoglycerate dehydrogenase / 2-oxoglutarate reductase
MYKIQTLNNIALAGLECFARDRYEVASDMQSPDALLLRSANIHNETFPSSLQAIGRAGAGVNNIPVNTYSQLGVPVFNAPGANANAVCELVLAGMLLSSRNICQAWQFSKNLSGTDEEINKQVEAGKKQFVGSELPGRTLGVIGLGAIGVKVANMALRLGMNVIGYDPGITVKSAWQMSSEVKQGASVDEVVSASDIITLHVPLVEATRNIINAERLANMKSGGIVLNFSRHGIIDDQAVVKALDEKQLHAYACDFPGNLLSRHERVVTLPHLGASTREAEDNCAVMVAKQLCAYLEDGNITNSVNFPEMFMLRTNGVRLTISNANVPNMVGQISTTLADANLNILDMLNRSRGDMAYTIVDVDDQVSERTLAAIGAIDGVLSVRHLF